MRAMMMEKAQLPLKLTEVSIPVPHDNQLLIKISCCGVCRTDLHIVDGELSHPKPSLIPGHEIIGYVAAVGKSVTDFRDGDRVGVPWLGYTCGDCKYCRSGLENLCDHPLFTGYTTDGGYAEYAVADARYCFKIPSGYSDQNAAPLLCAGLIGYRSYRMIGPRVKKLGIYGFGAAAHILIQIARFEGKDVYAFTRSGDGQAQDFARSLGATWAGSSEEQSPEILDAAIIFAPIGALIPKALQSVDKGGTVICGGIHMSDIPSFPYQYLWEERSIRSVANLQRQDAVEFFDIASRFHINTEVVPYPLIAANEALSDLRNGRLKGAAVLNCS